MAVGALELKFWEACCDVLERPDLKPKHWALGQKIAGEEANAVKAELDALFAQQTLAEWTRRFAEADCCVSPILRTDEAVQHALFRARQMAARTTHASEGDYWATGTTPKLRA